MFVFHFILKRFLCLFDLLSKGALLVFQLFKLLFSFLSPNSSLLLAQIELLLLLQRILVHIHVPKRYVCVKGEHVPHSCRKKEVFFSITSHILYLLLFLELLQVTLWRVCPDTRTCVSKLISQARY